MSDKSKICFGKQTGKPLTEYYSKHQAEKAADYRKNTCGENLFPYECDKCGLWHLSSEEGHTPCSPCPICTDSDGERKLLYDTKEAAVKRAAIQYKRQGVSLSVYPCSFHSGWHLTKG